ncbi:mannose-binding lectin [Bordetella trematum]|uniref:mannose-binding lectin n=1 Tax=Bordetella trematum TaxID=123899 RepID=UPI000DE59D51|nr:CVNH domain-containing protein [Bordetella trematum]
MKMTTRLTAVTLAALAMSLLTTPASAGSSTFQNSCRNIKLHSDDNGAWISAECRTRSGNYTKSSIAIRGLINDNGRLRGRSGEQTSYQKSCRDRRISWSKEKVSISAVCRTRAGSENNTSIEILNIENQDGKLVRR